MRIELEYDDILRHAALLATPGEYDGFPSPSRLVIDWVPRRIVGADRLAVAGALSFAKYVSGALSVEGAISKQTAIAIQRFFGDRAVDLQDVTLRPREPARGPGAFLLGDSDGPLPSPRWVGFDAPRQIGLIDHPSFRRAGSSFEGDMLHVPSNAWAFSRSLGRSDIRSKLPQIAYAILMAEDFEIGELWLPSSVVRDDSFDRVVELLKSVDLAVGFWPEQ